MAVDRIDPELCNGCGICVDYCPADVLRLDEKTDKAVAKYPQDCTACRICETDCPQKAITVSMQRENPPLTLWGVGA